MVFPVRSEDDHTSTTGFPCRVPVSQHVSCQRSPPVLAAERVQFSPSGVTTSQTRFHTPPAPLLSITRTVREFPALPKRTARVMSISKACSWKRSLSSWSTISMRVDPL